MKISQVFETSQFLEWLSSYKRSLLFNQLNEQTLEDLILSEKRVLNAAINLLYYLSAKNADIRPVKRQKKKNRASTSSHDDSVPAVKQYEVGAEYSDIVYRHLTENTDSTEDDDGENDEDVVDRAKKSGKKRRPHARRAHWQHYWTGEGRTKLELRWKSDLFVGANRDNQAVIVYDVPKETMKGKRNPNTSKKKRRP